jgi:hypothetical protein
MHDFKLDGLEGWWRNPLRSVVCGLVCIQYAMYFLRTYYIVDVVCGYLGSYSDVVCVSILLRLSVQPLLLDEQWRGRCIIRGHEE